MTSLPVPPPVVAGSCPKCGAPITGDSNFCESCGASLAPAGASVPSARAAPVLADGSPPVDLDSGPISAATSINTPTQEIRVQPVSTGPCVSCGGVVGPDGYCENCGLKAQSPRDHYREHPAAWVAGVCDRGVRHYRNEDAMATIGTEQPGGRAVLIVLDGVSNSIDSDVGSMAGAKAAAQVLRTPLPQGMGTPGSRLSAVTKTLTDAVQAADDAIVATTDPASTNPASATFAVAVVEPGDSGPSVVYANVGDSRVYWFPDASDGVQLSLDDSAAEAQIAAGVSREVAESSPQAHAITKWLGKDSDDIVPRVGELPLTESGWVMVCSDGLWNYASEPGALVARIRAAAAADPAAATDPAVLALALVGFANDAGGQDNVTVTLARIDLPGSSGTTGPASGSATPADLASGSGQNATSPAGVPAPPGSPPPTGPAPLAPTAPLAPAPPASEDTHG